MKDRFPLGYNLFMRIAEPRAIRIMQFGIYICIGYASVGVITNPPSSFENVIGSLLVLMFGGFLALGSLFGAVAVLPGIWWLERVGLISLFTGLLIYIAVTLSLGVSVGGFVIAVAFALTFAQRWTEIRKFQLAPKELIDVEEV